MTRAWQRFTPRGKGLVVGGVLFSVFAFLIGQPALLSVGALALVTAFGALVWMSRRPIALDYLRTIEPGRISVGSKARVTVQVTNRGSVRSGALMVFEPIPTELGGVVRRVVSPLSPGQSQTSSYEISGVRRGRHEIGPVVIVDMDPFGLVTAVHTVGNPAAVLVVPQVVDLPPAVINAEHFGRGDGRTSSIASRGIDDVVPRAYRVGDDLRRIHWRASARSDELMVRREERPWAQQATIVIDTRSIAIEDNEPNSSLDVALSCAASVGVSLMRLGWGVRILATDGREICPMISGLDAEAMIVDRLCLVELSQHRDVQTRVAQGDLVIAIIGSDPGVIRAFSTSAPRSAGDLGFAIVLDTAAWWVDSAMPVDQAIRELAAGGWRAEPLRRDGNIIDAWRGLARIGALS